MEATEASGVAGSQGECITADGRRLVWTETGCAPVTLMFIHGWCCDRGSWRHQLSAFGAEYHCVALDLAGHGATSPLAPAAVSVRTLAQDVRAVLEVLHPRRVVLIGHSLGGPVAVETAIADAHGIAGLIGVDTLTDERVYARRPDDEIRDRLAPLQADLAGALDGLVRMITRVDRQDPPRDEALVDELVRTMSAVDVPVAVATMRALLEWDIASRWPLLAGAMSTINSRALLPLIAPLPDRANLQVRLLEDVGHFPMREDPRAFNAELRRRLNELLRDRDGEVEGHAGVA